MIKFKFIVNLLLIMTFLGDAFGSTFDLYPEVRRGLFLHLCDVIHKKEPDLGRDLIKTEIELDKIKNDHDFRIASLCLYLYDIKFRLKQDKERRFPFFRRFVNFFRLPLTDAQGRASVSALAMKDGSQFILMRADTFTHEIFCKQEYYRQRLIDPVWPIAYEALQTLEPDLVLAWESYLLTTPESVLSQVRQDC